MNFSRLDLLFVFLTNGGWVAWEPVVEAGCVLLSLSEQLGNAVYQLCVDGNKMKYRRTGSVFRKDGEDVLKMD